MGGFLTLWMIQCLDVRLARTQRDQPPVADVGDGDNSLSMRWVKLGSCSSMNHAAGAGGGRHCVATGWILGKED